MVVFVDKTYVVASIMRVKRNFLNESFVTYKELEYVSSKLQAAFNEASINAIIVDKIDQDYYAIVDVISLNNNNIIALDDIEESSYIACSCDVLQVLCDENYIRSLLIDFRKSEVECLEKGKTKTNDFIFKSRVRNDN